MIAASKNYTDIVEFLILNGADVDKEDKFGKRARDRTNNERIFFMLTSQAMNNRLSKCFKINDKSKFSKKSLEYVDAEIKCKQMINEINTNQNSLNTGSIERNYKTNTPSTTRHFPQKLVEEEVLNEAFRKNLAKLKKEFTKISDKAIENKVIEEICDDKQKLVAKIKTTIQKMSKKLLK